MRDGAMSLTLSQRPTEVPRTRLVRRAARLRHSRHRRTPKVRRGRLEGGAQGSTRVEGQGARGVSRVARGSLPHVTLRSGVRSAFLEVVSDPSSLGPRTHVAQASTAAWIARMMGSPFPNALASEWIASTRRGRPQMVDASSRSRRSARVRRPSRTAATTRT